MSNCMDVLGIQAAQNELTRLEQQFIMLEEQYSMLAQDAAAQLTVDNDVAALEVRATALNSILHLVAARLHTCVSCGGKAVAPPTV